MIRSPARPSAIVRQMTRHTVRAVVFDWAGTTIDYGCRARRECLS